MTVEQIIGFAIALGIMCLGVAGSVLPGLPSTPLVLVGAVAHKLYFGDAGADWWVVGLLGGFMVLSLLMDYLASIYGAKRLGATWRGMVGALVGGIIGLFFSLPGILIGPFVGAMLFELVAGRDLKASSKAGLGATLGLLAGALGKVGCSVAMMGVFAFNVIYRSLA
jgi:uncharacterized protein